MNILEKLYRRAMRRARYGARGRVDTRMAAPLLSGVGLGAGLMYVMDPSRGARRRARVRDKLSHASHVAGSLFSKRSRKLRDRSRGALIETKTHLQNEQVPDELLIERVRARLGHATSHPRAIVVEAQNGCVTLRGPVLAADVGDVIAQVSSVPGVRGVDDALEVHAEADVPLLQGGDYRRERRIALRRERWSPLMRVSADALGGGLVVIGLRRGGVSGAALCAIGGAVVLRAVLNRPFGRALQQGAERLTEGPIAARGPVSISP